METNDITYIGSVCKRGHDGLRYKKSGGCVQCAKDKAHNWNTNNSPERVATTRKYRLKNTYGITPEQYELMLEAQSGCCSVCSSTDKLCIDHCHTTKIVRGILCHSCNVALGHLRDDPEIIKKLLAYVEDSLQFQ